MVTGVQDGTLASGLLQRAQAALESGGSAADELAALLQHCNISAPVRGRSGHVQLPLQRPAQAADGRHCSVALRVPYNCVQTT